MTPVCHDLVRRFPRLGRFVPPVSPELRPWLWHPPRPLSAAPCPRQDNLYVPSFVLRFTSHACSIFSTINHHPRVRVRSQGLGCLRSVVTCGVAVTVGKRRYVTGDGDMTRMSDLIWEALQWYRQPD
ncbi:unnamed protein product [Ectocarpus sp. 12 AP-2014]